MPFNVFSGALVALCAIVAYVLVLICGGVVNRFFGWSAGGWPPSGSGSEAAWGGIGCLSFLAAPVAAELLVFVPEWRAATIWVVACLLVLFLCAPPLAHVARAWSPWLRFYDAAVVVSLAGLVGWAALWGTSTGGGTFRWATGITAGFALLVLVVLGLVLPPLRARRRAAAKAAREERDERESQSRQVHTVSKDAPPSTDPDRRLGPPADSIAELERQGYGPAHPHVVDNASAQEAMLATMCAACGNTGYDVETYAVGGNPLWYLGRCRSCGHHREFRFG